MNILVIANCRLGDSLAMLPALKLLRKHEPNAYIALASEPAEPGMVGAKAILENRNIVDDFIPMTAPRHPLTRLLARIHLVRNLRRRHWDLGIVLMPPYPPLTMKMVRRLAMYLRLAGAKRILSPDRIRLPKKSPDGQLLPMPSVVDAMLQLLAPLGIPIPDQGCADALLPPTTKTTHEHNDELPHKMLIAVAPGANMPAKCWNDEKFSAVLTAFCRQHDAVPVYLGGTNERTVCEKLHRRLPGVVFIGHSMADVEVLLRRCRVFLGNDTGLGHLAAAVGIPCVSVFSARDIPGIWEPYTPQKAVLRARGIPCEGCLRTVCEKANQTCLDAISTEDVLERLNALLT